MKKKIEKAMNEISDKHIAEAASYKRKRTLRWTGAIAAVLAVVIFATTLLNPLTLSAEAVSIAKYPKYEWKYRPEMDEAVNDLQDFFALSMQQTLSGTQGENTAYSPINLYMALCLMAELTHGSKQILQLLNTESSEALRSQASEIWNACYFDDGDRTLLANSVWLDKGLTYEQSVMDTLADTYYTSVYQSDLQKASSKDAIRTWLNSQTGNMLKAETGQIEVDPLTVMLLYSTVYYQAKWTDDVEFSKSRSTEATFHAPSGDVTCTFMNKKEMETNYYWAENFGAVSLGLKDGSRMWLLLPDEGKTTDDVLASDELTQLLFGDFQNKKYMKVNLSVPKFDIRHSSDLKADLQALGVTDVFSGTADFSEAVSYKEPLFFTGVNQATRVAIDEKGVTAASYIEVPAAGAAPPPEEIIDFVLDRPFVFVIANRYGLPLFAGVVNEP